jgi:hypothetical protein
MSHRRRLRVALASFCLGTILLHLTIFWLTRGQIIGGLPDFKIFYTAGLILRRGQGPILYDDSLQLKTQREFVSIRLTDKVPLPYNHPPFEAIFFLPFTYLPFLRAYSLWFLLNGSLVVVSIYLIRPWIRTSAAEFPELLFLAPFAFFPIFYALIQGQDSILLLMLYCLAYSAFRRGQDLRAGVWLGLGLFKFHLILPFTFILLLRRRWQALWGVLLSGCCEFAASLALVGWRELLAYPRYAWHVNRLEAKAVIIPRNMPNLRGLLTGWSEGVAMRSQLELVLLALSLCLVVWASRQWLPGDLTHADEWNCGFSIAVVVTFLVGYHGYNQDLSIVFLPILMTFDFLIQNHGSTMGHALRVLLALMFLSPLYLLLTLRCQQQNLFALVLLAFVFCLAASWSRQRRRLISVQELAD